MVPSRTQPASGLSAAEVGARTDERLGRLVRLLAEHPMLVMSGTKLGEELGASRSEIWRLVQQLRELQVEISGHPSTGYRLERVPDLLLPEMLAPLIEGTVFAGNIHHFFRVGSTNTAAMQAAIRGEPEGAVFVGEEQTAGRGRGLHRWESNPAAGIYCSALLRPRISPADVLPISLATGLAVADAVRRVTGVRADLRWPNDVLCGGRKFCGILIELQAEATRVQHLVAGMGLNVNQAAFPEELRAIATSLRVETGSEWSRLQLAAALLQSLDREYRAFVADPVSARQDVFRRFEQNSSYVRGLAVHVEEDGGYEGITAGLDGGGFLLVQTGDRIKTVLSGGVRPR